MLAHTLALSGALMALLIGATIFSLVFRLFGTDRWLSALLLSSPWSPFPSATATATATAAAVLQLSFLIPPMGYEVMIARAGLERPISSRQSLSALAPFVVVQLMVVVAVFSAPWLVHRLDAAVVLQVRDSDDDIARQMQEMTNPSEPSSADGPMTIEPKP